MSTHRPRGTCRRRVAALGVLLAASAVTPRASAQDAAVAEKLFKEGRALMEAGELEEACPKLAESQRLDPGVGTLLNLGECYARSGKTASAWATYREAEAGARRAGQRTRMSYAGNKAAELEPKLGYIVIEAPDLPGLVVTRDGVVVGRATLGSALPVDAGEHVVEARAPGRVPFRASLETKDGARARVAVPVLALAPPEASPSRYRTTDGGGTRRLHAIFAVTLAGAGLASLAVGTAFGFVAKSRNDQADENHCTPVDCDARGQALIDDAKSAANVSTALFVAGGVLGGASLVVWLTAPRAPDARTRTAVVVGPGALSLRGTF